MLNAKRALSVNRVVSVPNENEIIVYCVVI